jgi:hypothetical protein
MDFIKSTLAKSSIVKNSYEYGRRRFSEYYRRLNGGKGKMDRYNELLDENSVEAEDDDTGILENKLNIKPHPEVSNPVLTRGDVNDCIAHFVADPFIVYENGVYNMFFEIKSIGRDMFIGHAFSEDGFNYEYNKIVISPETAQHTYPHVFKKDGKWLMVPSPCSDISGEFRVYEATDFPTEWELISVPISENIRLDPTPILHNGTWYLIYQNMNYDVVLMYSDSLTENGWERHPDSPIFKNNSEEVEESSIGKAEMVPSGRPIYGQDRIGIFYRSHTNKEVYQYKITELTPDTFRQEPVSKDSIFDGELTEYWNGRFMHTVNPVYPWKGTADIIGVDGLESDRYRYSIGIYTT